MTLLPFDEGDRLDPFAALMAKRPRMAQAIAAMTARRDTRRRRAKALLILLQFRCPVSGTPRRPWYTPGAIARQGATGVELAWSAFWDEEPPTMRTIREILRQLQRAGCVVLAPGDWMPILCHPSHPERRPRYPDTIHLLEGDAEATWWAEVGMPKMRKNKGFRHNPDKWAEAFGSWRDAARRYLPSAGPLFAGLEDLDQVEPTQEPERLEESAEVLEDAVRRNGPPIELLTAVAEVGGRIRGGLGFQMLRDRGRLRGCVALMAVALRRGRQITNRAGWLVVAWRDADPGELRAAIRAAHAGGGRARLGALA